MTLETSAALMNLGSGMILFMGEFAQVVDTYHLNLNFSVLQHTLGPELHPQQKSDSAQASILLGNKIMHAV